MEHSREEIGRGDYLVGAELAQAVADPATEVLLCDETSLAPAVWSLGSGWPGVTQMRADYGQRVRNSQPGDRGYRTAPGHIALVVGSNDTLPPSLRRYASFAEPLA